MDRERFEKQIMFLKEIDRVKTIFRQTRLLDDSRYENDAEHGWHLAVMAMTLAEYSNAENLDLWKVIRMILLHDIVEIDAGDILLYDSQNRGDLKKERETRCAERIFGLLPDDQRDAYRALWDEFEARETPESKFAAALDRFEPIIQNVSTDGHAWRKHGISRRQVEDANRHIGDGSDDLWEYVRELIEDSDRKGYYSG